MTILYATPKQKAAIREALTKVREDFCSGKIQPHQFSMTSWHCGTVGCIGGWAEHLYKIPMDDETDNGIQELFFGYPGDVTTCHAIKAIDNYLETGHPNWSDVMKA